MVFDDPVSVQEVQYSVLRLPGRGKVGPDENGRGAANHENSALPEMEEIEAGVEPGRAGSGCISDFDIFAAATNRPCGTVGRLAGTLETHFTAP